MQSQKKRHIMEFPAEADVPEIPEPETKKKRRKSKYGYLLPAFFLPLTIMLLLYIGMEVWPVGKNSVLVLDLNGQYVYYFEAFRKVILDGGNILYNWSRSLGGEFLGIFSYYLCSPFTLFVVLFPETMITEALLLLIITKVGMCGLTMAYYLRTSRALNRYTAVLFSLLYALCSYGVIQAMNTMWIDAMYLLPLVMLGLERLVDGKRPYLYCLMLAFLFLTNYYIGYMTCIFCVLYFFYAYFARNKAAVGSFLRASLRFALYSLIAAALAAILLIPAYYGLTFGKTEFQKTNYDFLARFDFLDFFTKLLPCSYDTVRPEGLPVVYSGLLTLLFAPLYMIAPSVAPKKKAWSGILCALLVMSMNASTVDIFWHGLSKPNWLNYRYSFMLCFFIIAMAAEAYAATEIKFKKVVPPRIPYKALLTVALAVFLLVLIVQKQDYEYIDDVGCIWVTLAFLAGYLIVLKQVTVPKYRTVARTFLMLICIGELFTAGLSDLVALDRDVVFSNRQPYADFMARFRPVVDEIYEADDGLYRVEKTVHRKVNDNMALGIRGISHSTSDLNAATIKFLGYLGYASRSHWSKYLGGTPVSDALLGIRYTISEEEICNKIYTPVYTENDLTVYENPYALGLLYTVSADAFSYDMEDTRSPFVRMNDIVTNMLGSDTEIRLFKPVDVDDISYVNCDMGFTTGHKKYAPETEGRSASITYTLKATSDDPIYIYFPSDYPREVDLTLNGESIGTYFGNETRRIVTLGSFEAGTELELTMTLTEDDLYIGTGTDYFYTLDTALYKEVMAELNTYSATVTEWDDTEIEGTFEKDAEHTLLFTTIPYDEGWNVTIDGEKQTIVKALDSMVAVDVSALSDGTHTIELSYMPRCYVYALLISVGGILLFGVCVVVRELTDRTRRRRSYDVFGDGTGVSENEDDPDIDREEKAELESEKGNRMFDQLLKEISEETTQNKQDADGITVADADTQTEASVQNPPEETEPETKQDEDKAYMATVDLYNLIFSDDSPHGTEKKTPAETDNLPQKTLSEENSADTPMTDTDTKESE